jgi:hypothetical protein
MGMTVHAGVAKTLIDTEMMKQDQMWGVANERADVSKQQLMKAASAQIILVGKREQDGIVPGSEQEQQLVEFVRQMVYPEDWDGFRSYGSAIANLVVAAAYLQQEIKRRIAAGESLERTSRTKPYETVTPYTQETAT